MFRGISLAFFLGLLGLTSLASADAPRQVQRVPTPIQVGNPLRARTLQSGSLIRVGEARTAYSVDGSGLAVAVLDTGIRATHRDFTGRVIAQRNYTTDNGGDDANAADGDGHGTHVSGIVMANGTHQGIAPGANVVAL